MAGLTKPRVTLLLLSMAFVAVLGWLRDPAWLADYEDGFAEWQRAETGTEYRWTEGRASFFVPADAAEIRIPLQFPFREGDWPTVVTITVDDRPADRWTIASAEWRLSRVRLPARGSRRFRRIDIHVDRTRPENRGIRVGRIQVVRH